MTGNKTPPVGDETLDQFHHLQDITEASEATATVAKEEAKLLFAILSQHHNSTSSILPVGKRLKIC